MSHFDLESRTESASAITIFIEAHGSEKNTLFQNTDNNTMLLSFVGMPGIPLAEGLSFCNNGKSIDVNVLEHLHQVYTHNDSKKKKKMSNTSSVAQEYKIKSIMPSLTKIYKECEITIPNGFTFTYPIHERSFTFHGGEHETCRSCIQPEGSSNKMYEYIEDTYRPVKKRCIGERKKANMACPYYGLFIVCSTNIEDYLFTMAGVSLADVTKSNIHMNNACKTYWKSRILEEDKKKILDQLRMTLTDIKDVFHSMGFTKIYIIDPTCRTCDFDTITREEIRKAESDTKHATKYRNKRNAVSIKSPNILQYCYEGFCHLFTRKRKRTGGRRGTKKQKNKKLTFYSF